MMLFRGLCLAYLICVIPSVASAESDRAGGYAECGYLAHVAVEQMKKRGQTQEQITAVIRDVVGFSHLFYRASGQVAPHRGPGINSEMLREVARVGRAVHGRRVSGMSPVNSLKLSNRVLDDCRRDLSLFAGKDFAH